MLSSIVSTYSEEHGLQAEIFRYAETKGVELVDALRDHGRSFDDLIYEDSNSRTWEGESPRTLAEFGLAPHGIPLVSFFAGCGGLDLGFEAAGFTHTAAFEINELFCKTLRRNRPHWNVIGPPTNSGDVANIRETIHILQKYIAKDFDGVFVAGPPCQPFSIAANQRFSKAGDNYKRIGFANELDGCLLFDFVKLVECFRPACFVIENVPGLRDLDGGMQLAILSERLREIGYFVDEPYSLNAADYGVPQFRERLFIVGNRVGKQFALPDKARVRIGCGSVLRRDKGEAANNETRTHKLESVRRYVKLKYGERDALGRVDRLDPSVPSKVVIAGGTKGGGRSHLHPEIPRTLSVRECARLQSFPDDFLFVGSTARQFTQVGNAVPPLLAAQIGSSIAYSIFDVNQLERKRGNPIETKP